jgi:quinol monooxygenase YgiN
MTDVNHQPSAGKGPARESGQTEAAASTKNWVLCVTFSIKPQHTEEFRSIVSEVIDEMRHEKTFVSSTLCHDPRTEGRFFVFEVWRDRDEFFTVQVNRPYRDWYSRRILEIQAADRELSEFYQIRADHQFAL